MADAEALLASPARGVHRKASSGRPPGITRWAVSAVSVVLIGQMCRSCTRDARAALQVGADRLGSMPGGHAVSDICTESRSRPQVLQR